MREGSLQSWLDTLSAGWAGAAAGSAAALTGALGISLLIKLARLSLPEEVPDHARILADLVATRQRLLELAHLDAVAVGAWLRLRRAPADLFDEAAPNQGALLAATQQLIDAPLEAMELCYAARQAARPLLAHGFVPALLDGQVGVQLLQACQRAMRALVRADLRLLPDSTFMKAVEERLSRLSDGQGEGGAGGTR